MISKRYSDYDVLTVAKQRIKNIFASAPAVQLSISGGKDSICLSNLVYQLCLSGEIDKSKLVIDFIDEEAIYPCVERVTKNLRLQWLMLGVEFRWWCIEVRHFNCFNQLTNDESFICWDRTKKDVWIRSIPEFALTDHPLLHKRVDTYQKFLPRLNRDRVQMIGIRAAESLQRLKILASMKSKNCHQNQFPIYDWTDDDVWKYILDNNLEIPDAYMYMYQVGVVKNRLRISQFFSVDTASSLVQMCEYYPELFDKICKREPNAYMAMLYYDTELFKKSKKQKDEKAEDKLIDYKAKALELIYDKKRFTTKTQITNRKTSEMLVIKFGCIMNNDDYKNIYKALVGGDPKRRALRSIYSTLFKRISKET